MGLRVSLRVVCACAFLLCNVPSSALPVAAQGTAPEPLDFLPTRGAAHLSPDGQRVAHADGDRLCVYAITGGAPVCAAPAIALDPRSVQWSPDSTRLAFTEDFFRRLDEPDIWTMDTATGATGNLTDDGEERARLADAEWAAPADVSPLWSPDGSEILFVRYTRVSGAIRATLCAVPTAGGPVTNRGRMPNTALDIYALSLSAGGSRLAFGVGQRRNASETGFWTWDLDHAYLQFFGTATPPSQVALAPDGASVLTFDANQLARSATTWGESSNRVHGVASGEGPVDGERAAHWAGWAPRGEALVYIVRRSTAEHFRTDSTHAGVYVVARPGERGQRVAVGDFTAPGPDTGRGLTWATNDTTLVRDATTRIFSLIRLPAPPAPPALPAQP